MQEESLNIFFFPDLFYFRHLALGKVQAQKQPHVLRIREKKVLFS